MSEYIKWFDEININDIERVGGKNASLGEMYQNLSKEGIRIPNSFTITSNHSFCFVQIGTLNIIYAHLFDFSVYFF